MTNKKPPFQITNTMIGDIAEIAELVGRLTAAKRFSASPTLRRANRIRTIHGSLAIEQNTLSLEQVTAVVNGKHVLEPREDNAEVENADQGIDGIVVSNRTLGFVNAPSLLQKAVAKCLDEKTNLAFYDENRKMLYEGLQKLGFHCIKPEGAFYMWVKSPDTDEEKFVAAGKKYNIIMVKGSAFGCAGYVRLAYCVSHETVKNALTAFEKLAEDYGLYTE